MSLLRKAKKERKILIINQNKKEGCSSMSNHSVSAQEADMKQPAEQIVAFLQELLRPSASDPVSQLGTPSRGRPRELSSDHLWLALLLAMLRGFSGFAGVWRLITWTGVGSFPLLDFSRAGVRKRLLQGDLVSLQALLGRVSPTRCATRLCAA